MILFTGGSVSVHAGIPPPRADTHPEADTPPPGADTPRSRHTHSPQSRHPPGADTPQSRLPPEQTPWEQTPPEQTPPLREADSGIPSTSGWYASYWNAFLFLLNFSQRERILRKTWLKMYENIQLQYNKICLRISHIRSCEFFTAGKEPWVKQG